VRLRRQTRGVAQVRADSPRGRAFGLGYAHAVDRGTQMALLRIVGRGEAADRLMDAAPLRAQDAALRSRSLVGGAQRDVGAMTGDAASVVDAYCAGVNAWFDRPGKPLVLAVLGIPEEPWSPVDCATVLRLLAWSSLAQVQEVTARLVARVAVRGTPADVAALQAAFAPHLDDLDPDLLRGVRLREPELELDPVSASIVPRFGGSNAFAVAGSRTASGRPLLANDPHLEAQVLPQAFYEASLAGADGASLGITVPGVPGVLAGRFTAAAVGVTSSFGDQIDFFVERCRDGRVLRGEDWVPAERVGEVWRSDVGVIEGDPRRDGALLSRAWVGDRWPLSAAFDVPLALERAADLDEAMAAVAQMPLPFNYVVASERGGIGRQQSGLLPRRPSGGSALVPRPAWDQRQRWKGRLDPSALSSLRNPGSGFVATANEAVTAPGGPTLVSAALSTDRVDRLRDLLAEEDSLTPDRAREIQGDVTSRRARRWLSRVGHLLPGTPRGRSLMRWDGVIDGRSSRPTLFARWRGEAMRRAWGPLFDRADVTPAERGRSASRFGPRDRGRLWLESNLVAAQAPGFEEALLDPDSALWRERDRDEVLRAAAADALAGPAPTWSQAHRVRRTWILFQDGRLSLGPTVPVPGSGATVRQGRVIRTGGRVIALQPVWRLVADLAESGARTELAGGPSDVPTSRWYRSGLRRFDRLELSPLEPPP